MSKILELPTKKPVTKVSLEIETELLIEVRRICKRDHIRFREVVEYGLAKFREEKSK